MNMKTKVYSSVTCAHTWSSESLATCVYMYALFDPSACLCQSIMSSRQDMHLWFVFVLHRLFLRLSFVLSVPRPSLQTRVTLLLQMAFCLAELHLWSTKSSLQVKGSTYQHVQSTSLPFSLLFFLSLSLRLALALCHHSLCFHTFFPHLAISTLTI